MKRVITYGTFDLFHIGHYNILKRAKELGDYLIVAVTGESYDTERGKLSVQDSLAARIENVKKTGFADLIIVEEYLGQKIADIIKYNVDILAVGSDWKGQFDHMNKYCQVVYLERTKNISSTQKREEEMQNFRFGIVTDDLYDAGAVIEPKHVSGIHLESVFAENESIAKEFCETYELYENFTDYKEFLDSVDIVYVKVERQKRHEYTKRAIEAGKHIIYDAPCSLEPDGENELGRLAKKNNVVLLNNTAILYLQAFSQLLWNARGNLIGDLVSIKCSISKELFDDKKEMDFIDLASQPVCAILKLLGTEYNSLSTKILRNEECNTVYGMISFMYQQTIASIEVSRGIELEGSMKIIGTKGVILVPNEWWRIGYFKIKNVNDKDFKRYSFNFDGNGFRYIVQEMLALIRGKNYGLQKISKQEADAMAEVLSSVATFN